MKHGHLQLHTKILLGLLGGGLLGGLANQFGFADSIETWLKPMGTLFIKLIRLVVVPLVFASLVAGIAGLDDVRKLGRIGGKTVAFYVCTTAIAISFGLLLANTLKPGVGFSEEVRRQLLDSTRQEATLKMEVVEQKQRAVDVLLNIIPDNPIRAFVEGNMLQVIFCALLMGVALTLVPASAGKPVIDFFAGLNAVLIQVIHLIMFTAPLGVFALIAAIVADLGLGILLLLCKYAMVVIMGLALYALLVYSLAVKGFSQCRVRDFFRGIRPAQLIAFSSSSSSATLPVTMECTERQLGVPREVSSFTLPLGATINMDGTALYQGISTVFIAQVYGMGLTLEQQIIVVLTATAASVGTAGAPAAGIVTLAMVLKSIGIPLEGIGLILGVERLLDMCRTVVNVTGDACCALVVATTENNKGAQCGTG